MQDRPLKLITGVLPLTPSLTEYEVSAVNFVRAHFRAIDGNHSTRPETNCQTAARRCSIGQGDTLLTQLWGITEIRYYNSHQGRGP